MRGIEFMKRGLWVVLIMLALTGCASIEQFQRQMDSYLGWELEQLRAHFGYNYIERDLGNGLRAFTWTWTQHNLRPGFRSPDVIHTYRSETGTRYVVSPGTYFPPDYYEYLCEFSFIVDATDRAVSWRAHGNGCAAYTGPQYVLEHQALPKAEPQTTQ